MLFNSFDQFGHLLMACFHIFVLQLEKGLVNRIDLQVINLTAHQVHYSVGEVAVKDVAR